ncbi:FecR family protein [Arcicella sp. LKC2W]|uniref:FecR family protein n=1 Tax=Arcicella sp. LKC2W TaxID=2984198 RepID=UPI002B20A8A9|nr:FecR family protein [Arcicella sp. LKC2W]MEA5458847.1 FecR family protein [Arcicella sp. LKC2W]
MSKQSFEYLLEKYLAGKCNTEEKKVVEQWFELVGNDSKIPTSEPEWNHVKDKMWRKIHRGATPTKPVSIWNKQKVRLAIAASITILLGLGIYYNYVLNTQNHLITSEYAGVITQENATDKIIALKLEDGSVIKLHPKATLSYPKHFLVDKREVTLKGNAFFDIKRNPNKPFMVLCGETITKVLGTSFLIKSDLSSKIQVEVKTGKVSVYEKGAANPKENGVVLTPNEKVVYFDEDNHFVTGLVATPEVLVTVKDKINFDFRNAKLAEVLQKFRDAYGIEIFLEDEKIANCTFTGDLNTMPIYNQLDFLCQSLNANYQIKGTDIIVSGRGCF